MLSLAVLLIFSQPGFSAVDDSRQEQDRHVLDQVKTLVQQNRLENALALLETFQDTSFLSQFLDEAYFLEATILQEQGQDQEAIIVLEQLLDESPMSPLLDETRLMLGALYTKLGPSERAVAILNNTLQLSTDPHSHRKALRLLQEVYEREGNYSQAIQLALSEIELTEEQDRHDILDHIQTVILQNMNEPALVDLLDLFPRTFPGDLAMIRLIELHTAQGDEVLAERDIRSFLRRFPQHPYAQTAIALLQSFISKIKAHDHVVATILPFSGQMKPFGIESLNGIRLALEDAQVFLGPNAIGLVVKEPATTPTAMRHQYAQLLEEFQPISVIGPLLAREVQMIAALPDQAEVPFITPSATLQDIRQYGRFWFSTALTSSLQLDTLVAYAMDELGYRRFCMIHPKSAYGRNLTRQFQKLVERRGGEIIAIESYRSGTTEVSPQIIRLKKTDMKHYGEFTTIKDTSQEDYQVYVPGFDAVFLPGQPVEVAFIAAQLAFYDIMVPLLGPNVWNSPDLLRWSGNSLNGSVFVDGLFLQTPDQRIQAFIKRYQERFGTTPSLFAIQAYDAMQVIADTIRHGATSSLEVRDHLFQRQNLSTFHGLASFGPRGILNRKVYLIGITKKHFQQIN